MTDRTVSVKLTAEISGYMAGLRTAARSTKDFHKELAGATGQRRENFDMLGKGLLGVGTAAATGLGMATKAAIEWESAWTGVAKTVDGNATQMATLEGELRDLTKVLPATHEEIAGVAEAAGQLGIKREDIADFTKTMIDLGETTNLTAEQAATSIAQISTVMGTSSADVDRFGAALVELGNHGASTEAEILMMAQRIAGAGNQIGLTETDVLGFASALASVGIEAEAGGSSISTAMIKMAVAVNDGGDALDGFAKVAGMSGEQFSDLFERDAGSAITAFVEGLGRMQKAGGDVFGVLQDLGLSEIRTRDAMLRLAGAGGMLGDSLDDSARAWQENTALTAEAEQRYKTTAAQIQMAWNSIKDAAIEVGSSVASVIGDLASVAGAVAAAFNWLPDWAKEAVGALGGIAAAAALAGGAFLLMVPRIAKTRAGMADLGLSMSTLGKRALWLLGPLGILVAIGQALGDAFGDDLSTGELAKMDEQLTGLVDRGKAQQAAAQFKQWAEMLDMAGVSAEDLTAMLPGYSAALEEAAEKTGGTAKATRDLAKLLGLEMPDNLGRVGPAADAAAGSMEMIAGAFGLAGEKAEDTAKNVDDMLSDWSDAFAEFAPMVGAYEEALAIKEEAERKSAEKTAESTEDSKDSWEDYVGDVTVSVDEYLKQLERMIEDQENWRDNMIDLAGKIPAAMLDELADLGPESAGMVALLNKMTAKELRKQVKLWEETAGDGADAFAQQLAEADPVLRAIAAELGTGVAQKVRDGMKKHKIDVFTEAKKMGITIDDGLNVKRTRVVKTDLNGDKAVRKAREVKGTLNDILGAIDDEGVQVKFTAAQIGGHPTTRNADGNVYENHQAQIAPGGAWRLWAEPETGGEAYIPLAASKRQRSLDILGKVAEKFGVGLMPFADGGATIRLTGGASGINHANLFAIVQSLAQANAAKMITAGMMGGFHPGLAGALAFVSSQVGKPYGWGAVGPGSYDCSGLISAAVNIALGRSAHSRLGSTATFPWSMFAPGPGAFMVGSFRGNPGHMAGTVNGVNIESRGGDGVVMGASARGANSGMFTTRAHLRGFADGGFMDGDAPFDLIDPRGMYAQGSFRYGTKHVPWDGLYQLHRGEQVSKGGTRDVHLHLHNQGVIGSQYELQDWLVRSMDKLKEDHRV